MENNQLNLGTLKEICRGALLKFFQNLITDSDSAIQNSLAIVEIKNKTFFLEQKSIFTVKDAYNHEHNRQFPSAIQTWLRF